MSLMEPPSTPGTMSSKRLTNRNTNRYSVTALFSMAAEQDVDVEDDLGRGTLVCAPSDTRVSLPHVLTLYCLPAQKRLRELKARISAQSKKNFVLERDVRYLDIRIALLIRNRMDMDEVSLPPPDTSNHSDPSHLFSSTAK
jgi:Ras GTPase-activating-like protein IQGAP2/3